MTMLSQLLESKGRDVYSVAPGASVLDAVRARTGIPLRREPPASFELRRHEGREEEKERFAALLERFAEKGSA